LNKPNQALAQRAASNTQRFHQMAQARRALGAGMLRNNHQGAASEVHSILVKHDKARKECENIEFTSCPVCVPQFSVGLIDDICNKNVTIVVVKPSQVTEDRATCGALDVKYSYGTGNMTSSLENIPFAVNPECIAEFNEFKLKNKNRYILFKLSDNLKEVVIEKKAPVDTPYSDFVAELPDQDCRYAVYNFEYDSGSDGHRAKIVFFIWAPDTAPTKKKMIYASTKDAIKKAFQGLSVEMQATDKAEADFEEVLNKCKAVSK